MLKFYLFCNFKAILYNIMFIPRSINAGVVYDKNEAKVLYIKICIVFFIKFIIIYCIQDIIKELPLLYQTTLREFAIFLFSFTSLHSKKV